MSIWYWRRSRDSPGWQVITLSGVSVMLILLVTLLAAVALPVLNWLRGWPG